MKDHHPNSSASDLEKHLLHAIEQNQGDAGLSVIREMMIEMHQMDRKATYIVSSYPACNSDA